MAKEDEGYLLDGSGNRVLSGSGEAVRTGSYDDDKVTQNRRKAAEDKLAEDVQKKLKEDKAKAKAKDDADFAAEEARGKTARAQAGQASAPSRMPTRPSQSSSGRKPAVVTKEQLEKSGFTNLRDYMNDKAKLKRRDGKAPDAAKPAAKPSELTDKPSAPAAKSSEPVTTTSKPAAKTPEPTTKPPSGRGTVRNSESSGSFFGDVFRGIRKRGEDDLKSRGMKAGGSVKMAKGKSINGIAKRGLTNCKQR